MATGCIWQGTAETAEFWHTLNASFHLSGRGSEVSLVKLEGLSSIEANEDVHQCKIPGQDVQRQKDGPFQTIPIYPHRDSVFEDFCFSAIHLVEMVSCQDECVFPTFSKAALNTNSKTNYSDGKASSLWSNVFEDLLNTFETISDRINSKLSSHCNKKGSNQVMANSPSVSGLAQIFRTGWELRGCDALFECIAESFVMQQQAGKAVSNWHAKIGDLTAGGQPPIFRDIEGDHCKLQAFTNALFEDDISNHWNLKVRELLAMTLLLRCDQFLEVLETHQDVKPNGSGVPGVDFTGLCNRFNWDHLFACRMKKALDKSGIGEVQFGGWISEARNAFPSRNISGLPIKKFSLCGGNKNDIHIDPRFFVDHFNTLSSVTQNIHVNVQRLIHMVSDIRRNQQCGSITESFLLDNFQKLAESVKQIKSHVVSQVPTSTSSTTPITVNTSAVKFSVNSRGLPKHMGLVDVFTAFFADNCRVGFVLDKESESWNDDTAERKRVRNLFTDIKRAVRFMLMHSDSHPLMPDDPANYKEVVHRIAKNAEERIRNDLDFGLKTISICVSMKHGSFEMLENTFCLPRNTPSDMVKFFKGNS